jgi:hypothetical protein
MTKTEAVRHSRAASAMFALSLVLPGCGGGPIHLAKRFEADPAVEWVFDAGKDFGFVWFYPIIADESVRVAAYRDPKVILLCLNSADELFVPSRAYVLGIDDGRVSKAISGPARAGGIGETFVTAERIYFPNTCRKDAYRKGYAAFDLEKGCVDWDPPQPDQAILSRHSTGAYRREYSLGPCEQTEATPVGPRTRYRFTLEHDRTLTIIEEWQGFTFDMTWRGQDGEMHSRRLLYRLPYRRSLGEALLANDDRRLLFAWTSYVICVDMRRLGAATEPAYAGDRARR